MNRYIGSITIAVVAIALTSIASAATAAEERPFKASVELDYLGRQWVERPYVWNEYFFGTGSVPHVGYAWHYIVVQMDASSEPITAVGTVVITAGSGDEVYMDVETVRDTSKRNWREEGTYTITGGTGKFAGAGGSGRLMGKPTSDWQVVVDYDGTISY